MKFWNKPAAIAGIFSVVTLSACGGGTSVVAPVLADGAPINAADYIGKTFPFRYLGVDASGTLNPTRGTGSIKVISATEIEVSVDGRTYLLNETLTPGEYERIDISSTQIDLSPALRSLGSNIISDSSVYIGAYGFQTDPADVPTVDFAQFEGTSELIVTDGIGTVNVESGTSNLEVDFANNLFSGFVYHGEMPGGVGETITIDVFPAGTLTGNEVSGTLIATYDDLINPVANVPLNGTDVEGWLYGAGHENLIGTFEGNFTTPLDGNTRFVGGFFGDLVP